MNNSQSFGALVFHEGEGLTSKSFKQQCSIEELQQIEQILKNPKLLDNLDYKLTKKVGFLFPISKNENKNFKKKNININCSLTNKQIDFMNKYRNKLNIKTTKNNVNNNNNNNNSKIKSKIDIPDYKKPKISKSKPNIYNNSSYKSDKNKSDKNKSKPNDKPNVYNKLNIPKPNDKPNKPILKSNRLPSTIR